MRTFVPEIKRRNGEKGEKKILRQSNPIWKKGFVRELSS